MRIFERGITIEIKFDHNLTEEEQEAFWREFIMFIEKMKLTFGGGHNEKSFGGYIDLSEITKEERIDFQEKLDKFVLSKTDIISDYTIKKKIYFKRIFK